MYLPPHCTPSPTDSADACWLPAEWIPADAGPVVRAWCMVSLDAQPNKGHAQATPNAKLADVHMFGTTSPNRTANMKAPRSTHAACLQCYGTRTFGFRLGRSPSTDPPDLAWRSSIPGLDALGFGLVLCACGNWSGRRPCTCTTLFAKNSTDGTGPYLPE